MRVALFAAEPDAELVTLLDGEGIAVDHHATPAPSGTGASAELVASFGAAEEALAGDPPDAAIVAGADDGALAAALTAVKLRVPTAWLRPERGAGDPLVARIADAVIDAKADASALAAAVRSLAAPTITAP